MRPIDADALSAFVGDLRSTLHKEQSTFKAMTDIEFNTRDYMLLNFQYAIDNAPTVCNDNYSMGYQDGVKKVLSERPQGEWIVDTEHSITMDFYKCTNCNYFGGNNSYRYCPRCGAKMRVKDELNNELNELGGNNESLL